MEPTQILAERKVEFTAFKTTKKKLKTHEKISYDTQAIGKHCLYCTLAPYEYMMHQFL